MAAMLVIALVGCAGADRALHPRLDTPVRAVAAFYQAVVAGDSARALNLVAEPPSDRTLLTDDVLKRSNELAPITNLSYAAQDDGRVAVTFSLGSSQQRAVVRTVAGPDGYRLTDGLGAIDFTTELTGVLVNGATWPAETASAAVFPGAYEVVTPHRYVVLKPLSGDLWLLPGGESETGTAAGLPKGSLSDAGRGAAVDATRLSLDACLAATDSNPSGCPQGISRKNRYQPKGKVQWGLQDEPTWDQARVQLQERPTGVSVSITLAFIVAGDFTDTANQSSVSATLQSDPGSYVAIVDLATDPPVVAWS